MKILFIIGSLNQGGAEFQILQLVKLFKDNGHHVRLYAITDHSFYRYFVDEHQLEYDCVNNKQSVLSRIRSVIHQIKEFKPDLIISYLKRVGQVAVTARLLSRSKAKVIVGERTADIQPRYDKYHFNFMRLANAVTVNSISKLDYLQKNFKSIKNKTYFFPNILDVKDISFLQKRFDKKPLELGFIGRISKEKNIVEMVQAVGLLRDKNIPIHFSIYGDARSPSYLESVKDQIEKDKLEKQVVLMGKTNAIFQVHKKIDLLILISDYEGFSNVISEALCSGLPVITSDITENKYLITNGVNGFVVNHKDPKDIARGIENYINLSITEKMKMSFANRKKAEGLFDKDKLYTDYMNLINSL